MNSQMEEMHKATYAGRVCVENPHLLFSQTTPGINKGTSPEAFQIPSAGIFMEDALHWQERLNHWHLATDSTCNSSPLPRR